MSRTRYLVFALCVFVLVFSVLSPAFASAAELPYLDPSDLGSTVTIGDGVQPIVSVSGYTVVAFSISLNSHAFNSSDALTAGSSMVYRGSDGGATGGLRITIPANSSAGRLYVCGLLPGYQNTTNTAWHSASASTLMTMAPSYYLTTASTIQIQSTQTPASWVGYIDLPAHSTALYLYLVATPRVDGGSLGGQAIAFGGIYSSNAFITFVPDNLDNRLSTISSTLTTQNTILNNMLTSVTSIDSQLANIATSVATPSEMEKFEGEYLDKMDGQLSQIEDMMSPQNTALPNGGDIAGFVNDLQGSLGASGSSFNAQQFSDAVGAFSGSAATGSGGPWEFFTQAIADSLSGATQGIGAGDDDYIYAWLEQSKGRYDKWISSSP